MNAAPWVGKPGDKELRKAAKRLAKAGQPVFPCKSAGAQAKAPLGSLAKNGVKDATTDVEQIKAWWGHTKDASIGLATGVIYDVLDVDIKEVDGQKVDGRVHLPYLKKIGLLNGCKMVVKTPGGGWHLYFLAAPALGLGNKGRAATLGLDVRGLGGYVLAPPSFIDTPAYAGRYVNHGATVDSTDEPLRWDLIVSSLKPLDEQTNEPIVLLRSEQRSNVAALREWVSDLKEGERNNGFHWAISRCIDSGIDPYELAEAASLIGLTDDEIRKTIGSALNRAGVRVEQLQGEMEAMFPSLSNPTF